MAHIEGGGGNGRRVNLEVNLVPFIDLMSVLITFLLLTAVWTQVSMIQIGSSIYGKRDPGKPMPPLPEDVNIVLKLDIQPSGYTLMAGSDVVQIPFLGSDYDDEKLLVLLKKAKEKYPNKLDGSIAMDDELPYERLIKGMDLFLKSGFPTISVLTGGP